MSLLLVAMYTRMLEHQEIRQDRNQQMPGFDGECAILPAKHVVASRPLAYEGHKPLNRALSYNDSYIFARPMAYGPYDAWCAADGGIWQQFARLKKYVDREAKKNLAVLERVKSMVMIVTYVRVCACMCVASQQHHITFHIDPFQLQRRVDVNTGNRVGGECRRRNYGNNATHFSSQR
ncbi:hypothetical protein RB195_009783 [Necator americanus]